MSAGEYFGEMALLNHEARKAHVIAVGEVECLVLQRGAFERLLGSLEVIMAREMQRRIDMGGGQHHVGKQHGITPHARSGAEPEIQFADLDMVLTIGMGTFGRVKLVKHRPTGRAMALKQMQKAQIVSMKQEKNVMSEKNIVIECEHRYK